MKNTSKLKEKKLAAFIITYNRTEVLLKTILKIFKQTLPPEKILVVDNASLNDTEEALRIFGKLVEYLPMSYNAGPAGGAKAGLKALADEGFSWIYWGDDDDPPPTDDCFEKLVDLGESYKGNCGQVGLVGHRFNKKTGRFIRTTNEDLYKTRYLEVDNIGGGMCKIINSDIILNGILPDEKLFFGFEELDFDLATKKAGYEIIVDSKLFLECREKTNRLHFKRIAGQKKEIKWVWREYYSIRNSLYIFKKNKFYSAFFLAVLTALMKMVVSYRHGLEYGVLVSKVNCKALKDFSNGRLYQIEKTD